MKNKVVGLLLALSWLVSVPAFANVGAQTSNAKRNGTPAAPTAYEAQVTDFNFVGANQAYFDGSTYTLDLTSIAATGGTINNVNIGATTPAPATFTTLQFKTPVQFISATANTVGTVTLAKTGYMFVLTAAGDSANYLLTLPSTNSTTAGSFTGETYTFTTATGSSLAIRVPSSTDSSIAFGMNGSGASSLRITSPASSGSTVTLVGSGRQWYIASMGYGSDKTNVWSSGSTA